MTSCLYSAGGGELGALGQQLQALAIQQMSSAARTQKHLSVSERSAIRQPDWRHIELVQSSSRDVGRTFVRVDVCS